MPDGTGQRDCRPEDTDPQVPGAKDESKLMLELVSVNVGLPREVTWKGKTVTTGIFKAPVAGPVALHRHNLDGDRQADLSVHGGPTKAVYVYPTQHYDYWRRTLEDSELTWGSFGENFTVEGADEEAVSIGDEFRVGAARVVVTEPRMPCFKLSIRFGRADMPKLFQKSQRTGFYLGVVEEGLVQAGDHLERVAEHPDGLRIADVTRLYTTERTNEALLRKAASLEALPEKWRGYFEHQLESLRQ
jgi:MOSC domain-containing protein YiiM